MFVLHEIESRMGWKLVSHLSFWSVFQNNIRDITDSLISFCQDKKTNLNGNNALKDQNIVGIVNELFGAGKKPLS